MDMTSLTNYRKLSDAGRRVILPSLLACDFANMERDIRQIEKAGGTALHLDIMDGHFVPNLSFGVPVTEAVRRTTDCVLDVHLMLSNPEEYFTSFRNAGADGITFHLEAIADQSVPGRNFARAGCRVSEVPEMEKILDRTCSLLDSLHRMGVAAGLSIIPPTDVEILKPCLERCDNVLIMSVMPGFGGQKLDTTSLAKLRWLRANAPETMLRSVDGGVNAQTLADCVLAGATGLVMGTAVFDGTDPEARFKDYTTSMETL
ncbi:MAG: ribulose-phosphate 3-epimerase [Planctomycetia bacterium]|nr:ribulose-phosphate 3-epimerase [Planctomycetia bacterium]